MRMKTEVRDYNEVDILYTLMTYINVSGVEDMHYVIAHTVLTNLERIPSISINDLADLCFTSPATISRFCKDVNCKNFASFKKELAIALKIASDEIHLEKKSLQAINEDPQELISKIYQDTKLSLLEGEQNVKIEDVDRICQYIHDAKNVHMMGYQFSKIVCTDFQLKMLKLKKFVYAFVNRGGEIQKLDTIKEDDLVIIVTVGAREELMDALVKKIKERNARLLMLTMNHSYKNPSVDCYYYLDGYESDYTQSSIMGSIDMMSFLNCIYVRYGLLYDNNK